VSSLIAQGTEFPLRKPAGFHWDLFLLGLTTGLTGFLGLPFPNGLIPQAPFHTRALCVHRTVQDNDESSYKGHSHRIVDHVVEQRLSNLAQGLLTLGTMTGPLLLLLHHIPQGVLAGLFFVMGVQAIQGNGITTKMIFLIGDREMTRPRTLLSSIDRRYSIWAFVIVELAGFAATFAITQTIAAIGFPVIILLLIPTRTWILPKFFSSDDLRALDAPTASPFTMESVGGNFGEILEEITGVADDERAKSSGATPVEVVDELERGEADGVCELVPNYRSISQSSSRRSTHRSLDIEAIELGGMRAGLTKDGHTSSQ
jgi:boron transporter